MIYTVPTRYEEFILGVKVETSSPQEIRVIFRDANHDMPNTELTNRLTTVNGVFPFYIRVPLSGATGELVVTNESTNNDKGFKVLSIDKYPLEKMLDLVDMDNPAWRYAVSFFQRFSYQAGVLPPGVYRSEPNKYNLNFVINYLPQIISDKGMPLNTCARISKDDGVIEVSRAKFVAMTVPERLCILLHEYSHFFENEQIDDEIEADLNALTLYLSLGYPRVDAYNAFLDNFIGAPTELNEERTSFIKKFITDFDYKHSIYYQK